jgi:hypothetical protein
MIKGSCSFDPRCYSEGRANTCLPQSKILFSHGIYSKSKSFSAGFPSIPYAGGRSAASVWPIRSALSGKALRSMFAACS